MSQDGPDPDPSRAEPRGRGGRAWWILATVVILFVGVHLAAGWADEPNHRRLVLYEAPIHLRAGEVVQGRFVPEHDGWYEIEVRLRREGFEEWKDEIGGRWADSRAPAGFTATCVVRDRGEVVHRSTTGERLGEGRFGQEDVGVSLTLVTDGRAVPLDVEVRVDRAVEPLAARAARLRVIATGDWILYAWLESVMRRTLVILAMALALIVLFVAWWVTARRRRRSGAAAIPPGR